MRTPFLTSKPVILGMDLSLRSTGAVVLPAGWAPGPNMFDVPSSNHGYELKNPTHQDRLVRNATIVRGLLAFAREHKVTHAFVEDHAYGLSGQQGVVLAELTGAVKVVFLRMLGLGVVPLNQSIVRKYFLGKLPRDGRAIATHRALRDIGCPWEDSDRGDAYLVANFGRTELGLPGLTMAGT